MKQDLSAPIHPRIINNKVSHVTRLLSGKGSFLVTKGQEVSPHDVIGKFELPSGFFTIDLAKKLSLSAEEAGKVLVKPIGSRIYKGELLAKATNLFSKTEITSPTDGLLNDYDPKSGILRLKFFPKEVNLVSGVYGIVDLVDQQNGKIWIKTISTQIFGVAGVGKPRIGLLKVLCSPSDILKGSVLKPEHQQHILVCGAKLETPMITSAIQHGITGLVAGGIDWHDFSPLVNHLEEKANLITDPGVGIMIFEGFGPIGIPDDIYSLLVSCQEKFVYLDGHQKNILIPFNSTTVLDALRKVTLPIQEQTEKPEALKQIVIGQSVRLTWPSTLGVIGKIVAIDGAPTMLESGIASYLLTIETASRKIRVPFQNIEII